MKLYAALFSILLWGSVCGKRALPFQNDNKERNKNKNPLLLLEDREYPKYNPNSAAEMQNDDLSMGAPKEEEEEEKSYDHHALSQTSRSRSSGQFATVTGQTEVLKCFHGSQFYEDGTQWTSTVDKCNMCYCNRGVTKCDVIICAELNCKQKFTFPGSCCQSCYNVSQLESSTNKCFLGGQYYAVGFAWYPYTPPNGFSTCTVCHCNASNLTVNCVRVDCPPLNCGESIAFRPHDKSCCKICPNQTNTMFYDTMISDQGDTNKYSRRDVLIAGGCKDSYGSFHENGEEWFPRIYFYGVEKCITCTCKDRKIRCERKKCTKRSCDDKCCMIKTKCSKLSDKLKIHRE